MRLFTCLFFVAGCSTGGSPDLRDTSSSVVDRFNTDSDADSDSDSDSDTDADADSDADSDIDTGDTGVDPWSCGDPALLYASVSVPGPGQSVSPVWALDLCVGVTVSGWYSVSIWDGESFVCQQGWEVSSSVPSSVFYPAWYSIDSAWSLEFDPLIQLDEDCSGYYNVGRDLDGFDIGIDFGGSVWFESNSYWWEAYPGLYSDSMLSLVEDSGVWDLDFDDPWVDFVLP